MIGKSYKNGIFYCGAIVIAILVVAVTVLAVLLGIIVKNQTNVPNVCITKSCLSAANMILENIDDTVDPCDDFHRFACGSFIKNQRIPEDQTSFDVFDVLENKLTSRVADLLSEEPNENDINSTLNAKKLYKSCVNEEHTESQSEELLMKYLKEEFGGWPILNNDNQSIPDPLDILVKTRLFGLRGLVNVYVTFNPKDPKNSILKVRQPEWFLNKRYYENSGKVIINAYRNFAIKVAQYLNSTAKDLSQQIDRMLAIEKELTQHTISEEIRRVSLYKNMTIRELEKIMPSFNWRKYIIEGMFKNVENMTMNEDEIILVDDLDYLTNATKIYEKYRNNQRKDFVNLLIWQFVRDRIEELPKKYAEARQDFDKVYRGTSSMQPRYVVCATLVLTKMEYATGRLFVSKFFNRRSKEAAVEMIGYILEEFKDILRKTEWMDDFAKQKALEKADYIDSKVGYPDFLYNETYMYERYKDYQFNEEDLISNYLKILKVSAQAELRGLRRERNRTNWISGPAVVNAFYGVYSNQICFPAGILQTPFYDSENPNYLNYGGIGSVIGHEITHGFDNRGRLYDKNGVFFQEDGLWDNITIENYKNKVKCIIDQYSDFVVTQVNRSLNGHLTQGENIADNGGIKQSFYAYRKWTEKHHPYGEALLPGLNFTQNQLFFISYAQLWCSKFRDQTLIQKLLVNSHSPAEFRTLGPTSNFDEFANAFNCKPGTRNNPVKKCSVW